MIGAYIVFGILALVVVASAAAMLFSRNAIYAAIFLVLNFVTVGALYLLLGAPFIALSQVAVYAGAIMVLFLFVIMLLGGEKLPPSANIKWQPWMAVLIGVVFIAELAAVFLLKSTAPGVFSTLPANFGSPAEIGMELFSKYALPFEATSVILLVAVIGAIVLTRSEVKSNKEETKSNR